MKAKLYSNFVKSGTLTGGKMEEAEEGDSGFVEDKVKALGFNFWWANLRLKYLSNAQS